MYRHAGKAGNPADVVKHAALTTLVGMLQRTSCPPRRFIDTHAGAGIYLLQGNGEYRQGIAELLQATPGSAWPGYLDQIGETGNGGLIYPGSPALLQELMRPGDRLDLVEQDAGVARELRQNLARDARVQVIHADAWAWLKGQCLDAGSFVLIDPPFQNRRDYRDLVAALQHLSDSSVMAWYPVIPAHSEQMQAMLKGLRRSGCAVMQWRLKRGSLAGCGLVCKNIPATLIEDLAGRLDGLSVTENGSASVTG